MAGYTGSDCGEVMSPGKDSDQTRIFIGVAVAAVVIVMMTAFVVVLVVLSRIWYKRTHQSYRPVLVEELAKQNLMGEEEAKERLI
jgi:hypothetical protein